jgi:hypothetical protein
MSGSRTNEGLKGSDVGTRSQDEDGIQSLSTTSNQELRRRTFFEHTNRSRRPALHRRNAALNIPRVPITTIVETRFNIEGGKIARRAPLGQVPADSSLPNPGLPTVPAVPKFPSFSIPQVPTVPAYPFINPSSQAPLSSPPPSPLPSDSFFTPSANSNTASLTANPTAGSISLQPSHNSNSPNASDSTPTTVTPTISVSYSNTTLITSTRSTRTGSAGLFPLSDGTAFSTRTSDSSQESAARSTGNDAAGAVATQSTTAAAPGALETSGSTSDSDAGSSGLVGLNTPQVAGSIVGGIAGLAVLLLIVLFFLRRYRRQLQDRGQLLEPEASETRATNTMSMRSSRTPLIAAVTASFKKMRPGSSHTTATVETGRSDRGFQRVAGRKIDPVLVSGGDGYGGNYGAFEKETDINKETGGPSSAHPESQPLAGTSFYRNTADFDSPHGSGTSTPIDGQPRPTATDNRDFANQHEDYYYHRGSPSPDVIAIMRPSPARSPVTTSSGALAPHRSGPPTMASDAPPTPTLPSRFLPDGVGRSLISQDGSRGSRFTESI